jgi:hypothetical protein
MAHPWMTFFIALAIADSVRLYVTIGRRGKSDEDE